MRPTDNRRLQKRLLNRIRHLVEEAEKLRDRVQDLCPEECRTGQPADDTDFLASEWQLARCAAWDLAEALAGVATILDPDSD
jgi:hypothetical protein